MWGHEEINFEAPSSPSQGAFEPVETPPELWLNSTVGASFPKADAVGGDRAQKTVGETGP